MKGIVGNIIRPYYSGVLNSYAQVFFSNQQTLAWVLIVVSFFDISAGFCGLLSILLGQLVATLFNFSKALIEDGSYTYNSLMAGIAIGMFYELNTSCLLLVFVTSLLTFFLTVWFISALGKKNLPFLSIPFLLAVWIILLGANNFSTLLLKQKESLSLYAYFPELFHQTSAFIGKLPGANMIFLYLRSLGAIFFQYNDLAGLVIAIGILYQSRMSFLLSIYGFLIGYLFYVIFEGDFSQLIYSYIGFNFVLTSIALGGFFIVPSRKSFLLLLITIPIIALLISALHTLFSIFQLPLYSLPFNIVVLLFLSAMQQRTKSSGLEVVTHQQFSPEKNHYKFNLGKERFQKDTYFHIGLPISGNWRISQGHDGKITHLGDWKYALDFDVIDDAGNTYQEPGYELKDYYCYNLPVFAPAAGTIIKIIDGIEDNLIGDVNLENNWGNTLIIQHSEYLYSKISHFKKGSFKIKEGDFVTKSELLGTCGSSGRSPEPHLHFQLQSTPYIGSKTVNYSISYYLTHGKKIEFKSFEVPQEGELISNVQIDQHLKKAFSLLPGRILAISFHSNGKAYQQNWEVIVDAYNRTYLYCHQTKSLAYFINNGTLFYFTDFYGDEKSMLFQFYQAAYKILLGNYIDLPIEDHILINQLFPKYIQVMHDFIAPFQHLCKGVFQSKLAKSDSAHTPKKMMIKSCVQGQLLGKIYLQQSYAIFIGENGIEELVIRKGEKIIRAKIQ